MQLPLEILPDINWVYKRTLIYVKTKMPNILSKYVVPGLEYRLEKIGTNDKTFLVDKL